MSSAPDLKSRLDAVRRQIAQACAQFDRDPKSVNLLAVSKTKPTADIASAIKAGQRDFGENYLQEALEKIEIITPRPVWHFIGAIQSNKTRPIAEHFDWVHTLASAKHARRLNDARPPGLPPLKVLIQVNISNEESKAGVSAADARALAVAVSGFDRLQLRGLMAIPKIEDDFEAQRVHFRHLAELGQDIRHALDADAMVDLSMGMSGDMEAAIAEGATWLRVGTAIFGPREK